MNYLNIPYPLTIPHGLPRWLSGKKKKKKSVLMQKPQETPVRSCVRKIPWRRKCQPTLVFLPGESQGQKGLASYSPWGHKELDTTEET